MQVRKMVRLAVATCVLLGVAPRLVCAEIVYLTSGRTLSIKDHREEGDAVVLKLRTGGEVTCGKDLIVKIVPDEVPHPDPAPPAAEASQKPPQDRSILQSTPYGELIAAAAEAHGVDPLLVRALIQVESKYQPRARSRKGAMGLMQLMPSVAREYNVRNAYDPKSNIMAGVQRLKSLIDEWGGDIQRALAAYNAGSGAVQKYGGIPPYRETQSYVSRILALWGGE
jgi:transglycosylase-like protein with SLT domain